MFDVQLLASSFNDQEDEGDLPVLPAWQQRELDDESTVYPVESARALLVESTLQANIHKWIEYGIIYFFGHGAADKLVISEISWPEISWPRHHLFVIDACISHTELFHEQTSVRLEDERPDAPEPNQLSLDLPGIFTPSKKLTDIWTRSIKALADEGNVSLTGLALAPSQSEIQQEFTKILISLFASIGQQLRYQPSPVVNITQAGRFTLQYQIKLCDRFFIVPDEAAEFLQVLRTELVAALSTDSRIKGPWGQIAVSSSGELIYSLVPPTTISDPSFTPAEDVK